MTSSVTLPTPCPVCRGPIVYSGRGRRPAYCSDACRRAERAEAARFRRAVERGEAAPVEPEAPFGRLADEAGIGSVLPASALRAHAAGEGIADPWEGGFLPEGYAARRQGLSREDRAAFAETARWLAEHAPDAVEDFPEDY
ncbi:hypothetical protein [Georgenia sp. H159]|uniref:hypothetical protein n=1 Tax=Georgenia sp. H159 TaxID=3076115 RepID=UPI002D7869F0|nr:hypothetical protein [Georgenia sp. H159]